MESLSHIIDTLVDDFLYYSKSRKLNIGSILKHYNSIEIENYIESIAFSNYIDELRSLQDSDSYIDEAYGNFNNSQKKNYITLLSIIVDDIISYSQYSYMKNLIVNGNNIISTQVDINVDKTEILLYNSSNGKFTLCVGDFQVTPTGLISGSYNTYSKSILSWQYIIAGIRDGSIKKEFLYNMNWHYIDKSIKINSKIFVVYID